ncbi:MAG: GspH/FimT family pseudopilin [Acinetobacter sp.]
MSKSLGFTISELATVITICSIIACLALPYLNDLMISNEVNQFKRTLTIHIQKAKSDAQIHHKNVTLCASQDLLNCHTDWNKGLIGFLDLNANRQRDTSDTLLYATAFNYRYGSLDWRGTLNINSITFQGDTGLPRGSNGSFFYCNHNSNQHTQLMLSNMGHIRTKNILTC